MSLEQVWKCGFCIETGKDKSAMSAHEDDCTFNPKNKGCYTCNNIFTTYCGGIGEDGCTKGHSIFSTENGECDEWKIEIGLVT